MKRNLFLLSTLLTTSIGHTYKYFLPLAAPFAFIGDQTLTHHTAVSLSQQNEKNVHPTNDQ